MSNDAFENGSPEFVPDRIALAILPMSQYPIPEYPSNGLVLVGAVLAPVELLGSRRLTLPSCLAESSQGTVQSQTSGIGTDPDQYSNAEEL